MLLDAKRFDFKWQHLHLKPLSECDLQLYINLYCCERVMKFIGEPLSLEQAKKSFAYALKLNGSVKSDRLFFSVTVDGTDKAAALSSISYFDRANKKVEIGSMVLPNAHGKRVGQDASTMLMQRIYQEIGISEFTVKIHPKNLPAIRAAKLLGFTATETSDTLNNATAVEFSKSLRGHELAS